MKQIAVLITCFNRKAKTLQCIADIRASKLTSLAQVDIFIVDGGSNDGTMEAVRESFPEVHIRQENGLYWAGGMRAAWKMASGTGTNYDFFWLVNDDTRIYADTLQRLMDADVYARRQYNKGGIYVGSTKAIGTDHFTYGGRKLLRWGHQKSEVILPDADYHFCELGNANIMLVSRDVYDGIGRFSEVYTHGIADYDYTLRAVRVGFACLVVPGYCGECIDDHGNNWAPASSSLKDRIRFLKSPKGLAYHEYLHYIREFFPKEYSISWIKLWLKTLVPSIWDRYKK